RTGKPERKIDVTEANAVDVDAQIATRPFGRLARGEGADDVDEAPFGRFRKGRLRVGDDCKSTRYVGVLKVKLEEKFAARQRHVDERQHQLAHVRVGLDTGRFDNDVAVGVVELKVGAIDSCG